MTVVDEFEHIVRVEHLDMTLAEVAEMARHSFTHSGAPPALKRESQVAITCWLKQAQQQLQVQWFFALL